MREAQITDEIIVAAAKENNCYDWMHSGAFADGFKAGVKWSQEEYKKLIWHDGKENPKSNTPCLVEVSITSMKGTYCTYIITTFIDKWDWDFKEDKSKIQQVHRWIDISKII